MGESRSNHSTSRMRDSTLLLLLLSFFICIIAAQDIDYIREGERPRRGGSGFVGMRGRRSMFLPPPPLPDDELEKRAAFTGMRGKKAPFNGMRGKKIFTQRG